MKAKLVIDRFEGEKAVLLAGDEEATVVWPRSLLPAGAAEGNILSLDLTIDPAATELAKNEALELLKKLENKG